MKENKIQQRENNRDLNEKTLSAHLAVSRNEVRPEEKIFIYMNNQSKLTRRYSIDDNGGGYLGL